ncbi:hydrolase, partial [Streptomyces sp. NPDC007851]
MFTDRTCHVPFKLSTRVEISSWFYARRVGARTASSPPIMEVRRMLGSSRSRHRLTTALAVFGLLAAGAAVQATSAAAPAHAATTYRVLFDDGHAEEAGNADWIISTSK